MKPYHVLNIVAAIALFYGLYLVTTGYLWGIAGIVIGAVCGIAAGAIGSRDTDVTKTDNPPARR